MDQDISLRLAAPGDVEAVCRLWLNLMRSHEAIDERFVLSDDAALRWKNDFPVWVDDSSRRIIVAERGSELIGFIQAYRRLEPPIYKEKPEVYIEEIYVQEALRGQGIGSQLLASIKTWAKELDTEQIRFGVLVANKTGIKFWESEGGKALSLTYTIPLETRPKTEKKARAGKLGF